MKSRLPEHIAIIMDGNGRWAKAQGLSRSKGHERGAEVVRSITIACALRGIRYLTLYAFSTENWKRSKTEVALLMRLIDTYLDRELPLYLENNIRFRVIGDITPFSESLKKKIAKVEAATASNSGLTQVVALNYGGQDEILRAAAKAAATGSLTRESFEASLDTAGMPPVDMLIRTSGEKRLSNFLLWQSAYAELFFTPTLWPDFSPGELEGLISEFSRRERRFGGVDV
ncbi:MAG: di-trans,poly-cis-decaprenylcistransferase [Campylobacterales bacterium]